MDQLLGKLNYKDEDRICILNAGKRFLSSIQKALGNVIIDTHIDPRYLYNFILIFAEKQNVVDSTAPLAIHNLYEDGILWYIYPKPSNGNNINELSSHKGWGACKEYAFEPVRHIVVNEKLSATRLRNRKFIRRRDKRKAG